MLHKLKLKKTNLILAMFLLIVLVLIVSCDFDFSGEKQGILPDYRVGYEGLEMKFIDTPNYDLFENDLFILQIDLQNKGAYDVDDGVLRINFPSQLISLRAGADTRKIPLLKGKSFFNPQGGFIEIPEVYDFKAGKVPGQAGVEATVTANACYHYKSQATLLACVGPRMGPGTCNFEDLNVELNLSQGQGAPLVIDRVEESISPIDEETSSITFQIEIENYGEGEVFRYLKSGDSSNIDSVCKGEYKFGSHKPIDVLNAFDFSLQLSTDYKYDSATNQTSGNIVCQPRLRPPHLESGGSKIICTISGIKEKVAYKTPLIITLDYGYRISDKETVTIQKPR
ncbi:hypothetical protein KY325_02215 [Candidatus Woesearchaeota archaeon]|nr:hypothetical protein [Candidatus Woesearchaeota archaeon]MBW3017951.1 hypothetical protein [Candidatus Woesearchaeota archaeon]